MNRVLLLPNLFFLLFLSHFTYSQAFEPGYFISNKGDTITGYIDHQNWLISPTNFLFKTSLKSRPIPIGIRQASFFDVSGERFLGSSFKWYPQHSDDKSDSSSMVENREFKTITAFVQQYSGGEVSLYIFKDAMQRSYFLIRKEQGKLIPLVEDVGLNSKLYVDTLQKVLNNPSLQSEIENLKYNLASIEGVLRKHNGKGFVKYERNLQVTKASPPGIKTYIQPSVLIGLKHTSDIKNIVQSDYMQEFSSNEPTNNSPVFGLGLLLFNDKYPLWGFYSELSYQSDKYLVEYTNTEELGVYSVYYDRIDQTSLVPHVALRVQPKIGLVRIFGSFGLSRYIALTHNNLYRELSYRYSKETLQREASDAFTPVYLNVGFGLALKNMSAEFRSIGLNGFILRASFNLNGEPRKS